MSVLNFREYYLARAETSRRLAEQAASPNVAAIHAELAERYRLTAAQAASVRADGDGSPHAA